MSFTDYEKELMASFKDDTYYAINPTCPCKECTGKGVGWIKHLNKSQLTYRKTKQRKSYLSDMLYYHFDNLDGR